MATIIEESDEKEPTLDCILPKSFKDLIDSDSESEKIDEKIISNDDSNSDDENIKKSNNRKILSSSSESETQDKQVEVETKKDRRKNSNPKKKILPEKKSRRSAVKALKVIKDKIKQKNSSDGNNGDDSDNNDEQHQSREEKEIRIPYHRPRQFTFKEFMARKTINKPTIRTENDNSAMKSMRDAANNIEAFALKMKQREDEALEFFRSESEDENEKLEDPEKPKEIEVNEKTEDKVEDLRAEVDEEQTEEISKIVTDTAVTTPTSVTSMSKDERFQRLKEKYGISFESKPALKLTPGSVIDLETGIVNPKKLTGPEILREKFWGTQPKLRQTKLTDLKATVQNEVDHHRPGLGRKILMSSLLTTIKKEKIEELKKRMEESKIEQNDELEPEDKADFDEEDQDGDESCEEEEEELEENDIEMKDKKSKGNDFLDDEVEVEDDDDGENDEDEEDESSSSSEEENEDEKPTEPRKSRIIKAFEDSDDEVEKTPVESEILFQSEDLEHQKVDLPQSESFFNSQKPPESDVLTDFDSQKEPENFTFFNSQSVNSFNLPSVSDEIRLTGIGNICDPKISQIEDDDLMDICSGQFAITQAQKSMITQADDFDDFVSQVETPEIEFPKEKPEEIATDTPDLNFSDFTQEKIVENIQTVEKVDNRKLLESSEDENEEPEKRKKKLKKRKKKKIIKKLGFSDDEDETENENENEGIQDEEEICEEEEEEDEVCVDYDSEENEIEVKLTKSDKLEKASKFFENEAEMSESEWGSADEDERGLNKYDIELGDEEEFDQNKLQEEVGQIHARKVLDDDIKNLKKIQDLLFDEEENDGAGRDRKFRWKNQTEGFNVNDENAMDADQVDGGSEDDEESEIMWRKMRHERETFLKEISQTQTTESNSEKILIFNEDSQTVTSTDKSSLVKKKFKVVRAADELPKSLPAPPQKFSSPFLIKTTDMKRYSSSSFLTRDEQTLSRIAKFVSHKDDEITMSSTGNSMSFVMLDKPDESKKRKSSDGNTPENSKKIKLDKIPSRPFLLDQLK